MEAGKRGANVLAGSGSGKKMEGRKKGEPIFLPLMFLPDQVQARKLRARKKGSQCSCP
jgi:hypothetical protein